MEQAPQSRLYRNYWVRLEREPFSRIVDVYTPTTKDVPSTIGVSDLMAIYGEIGRVLCEIAEEQAAQIAQRPKRVPIFRIELHD